MIPMDPAGPGLRAVRSVGGYTEFAPPADLADCVEAVWTYRAPLEVEAAPHRVLPHTGVTLVLRSHLDDATDAVRADLYGPVRTVRQFTPSPGLALDAIQLRPEWSRGVMGVAPEEHVDRMDDWAGVDKVAAGELLALHDRHLRTGGSALQALIDWIRAGRPDERPDATSRVARAALRRLRDDRATGRVRDVAAELGVSAKHIRRAVSAIAGDRPKTLQRLDRLNRTVADADVADAPRWSTIATRRGYFDQAHLIRDFRELAQRTPSRLHGERRAQRVPFFQSRRHPAGQLIP